MNATVAAVVFESSALLFILLLRRITNQEYHLSRRDISLNLIALAAATLVVLSDTSTGEMSVAFSSSYLFGIALLLASMIFTLQTAPRLKQSQIFVREILPKSRLNASKWDENSIHYAALFLATLTRVVSVVAATVFLFIFHVANLFPGFTEPLPILSQLLAFIGGATVGSYGAILNTRGTLKAKNLRIQAVRYSTPIFGVLYLLAIFPISKLVGATAERFNYSLNINWLWFVTGLIGVVAVNVTINCTSEEGSLTLTSS